MRLLGANKNVSLLILVALLMGLTGLTGAPLVTADSNAGGVISENTTWTAANSPYVITASAVVNVGVTLTIDAGVTVRFESGKALQVDGELIARGTEAEPIVFTSSQASVAPGDWVNVSFIDSSIDATYDGVGNYVSGSILQYCTVQYGGGGDTAVIAVLSSSPLIDRCNIQNNSGGGILVDGGSPRISNNTIRNNSATFGGGIHLWRDAAVLVVGNTIRDNVAWHGGGVEIGWVEATIRGNTITNNSATKGGGIDTVGTVTITDNGIGYNTAEGDSAAGGGIFAQGGTVVITNNDIYNNSTGGNGGGISATGGTFNIANNIVRDNSADAGGGIHGGTGAIITGNAITGNSAYNGGGIFASGGTIRSNTIRGNSASSGGGGIFCNPGSQDTVLVEYSNVVDNSGNGITIYGQLTSVSPSTVHSNNIYSNEPYSIANESEVGIPEVDATGNWWGTTDEASIEGSIHDWNDDASLGRVVYQPFATAPVSEAPPMQHALTLSSTTGGSVTTPGEGTFAYAGGTAVDLVAEADEGYRFVNWTGNVGTVANVSAASTAITMNGD